VKAGVQEEDLASAEMLVHNALQPESNVDFPQITELCERLEAHPGEITPAITLLVAVLGGPSDFCTKLKALTIMNEMLYNRQAVETFCSLPGLRHSLKVLQNTRDAGLAPPVAEGIRMLSTEIDKVCASSVHLAAQGHSLSSSCSSSGSDHPPSCSSKLSSAKLRKTMHMASKKVGSTTSATATRLLAEAAAAPIQLNSALTAAAAEAEKNIDWSASAMQKAFGEAWKLSSSVFAELNGKSPYKGLWNSESATAAFGDWGLGPAVGERSPTRSRQVPVLNTHKLAWERQSVA